MKKPNDVNKMNIIIQKKSDTELIWKNKDELLENLKEISPEELENIWEEMRKSRARREYEEEKDLNTKYRTHINEFIKTAEWEKTKNMWRYFQEDSKVTENWERFWIALLYDYRRDYDDPYSDPERWVKLFVKVWDYETSKEIVYVDAKWTEYDDWSKAFTKIDRLSLEGNTLKVWLSKWEDTPVLYKFDIPSNPQKKERINLWYEAKEAFKKHIISEKERLVKELTKNERYPNVFWYWARQIPNLGVTNIPYDQASIVDEHTDLKTWECYVVIKTQIDADALQGKKYSWQKYRIKITEYQCSINFNTQLVEKFDAREHELATGTRVKLKARE